MYVDVRPSSFASTVSMAVITVVACTVSWAATPPMLQVSNGAVASLADTLPLLHPFGYLLCHDLFLTDAGQYRTGFRGPGKYDGSVVNWVNGPLPAQIGGRRGFDVSFEPFRHRAGSNVKTLTVRTRD